jgi:hypothetical protein
MCITLLHCVSQGAEEGTYVLDQRLWLLQCCEMSSRFHLCPTLDSVETLCKGTRWNRDLVLENSHARWNLNPPGRRQALRLQTCSPATSRNPQ